MTRTALAITRRPRFLSAVPSEPPGQEWIYQLARAFQLSPTEIGLVANIRRRPRLPCRFRYSAARFDLARGSPGRP